MVAKIAAMQMQREWPHQNILICVMINVNEKASKRTLKHYCYNYLSQSDNCQSESAQEKKTHVHL